MFEFEEENKNKRLFEKEKYVALIGDLESSIKVAYVVIVWIAAIISIILGFKTLILTVPIGIIVSYLLTFVVKIKIQEMKIKTDLYDHIIGK